MELEAKARDHQKVMDLQENELGKVKDEVTTYQQLLEVTLNVNSGVYTICGDHPKTLYSRNLFWELRVIKSMYY